MEVISVNISEKTGTTKQPVEYIEIVKNGVAKDAHAGDWHRQVSLLAKESIEKFGQLTGDNYQFGDFAENITTQGIDLLTTKPGDKLKIGESLLEVTQIGKECHGKGCAIFIKVGKCVMPKEGIFCKVIEEGIVKHGDKIEYLPA